MDGRREEGNGVRESWVRDMMARRERKKQSSRSSLTLIWQRRSFIETDSLFCLAGHTSLSLSCSFALHLLPCFSFHSASHPSNLTLDFSFISHSLHSPLLVSAASQCSVELRGARPASRVTSELGVELCDVLSLLCHYSRSFTILKWNVGNRTVWNGDQSNTLYANK